MFTIPLGYHYYDPGTKAKLPAYEPSASFTWRRYNLWTLPGAWSEGLGYRPSLVALTNATSAFDRIVGSQLAAMGRMVRTALTQQDEARGSMGCEGW